MSKRRWAVTAHKFLSRAQVDSLLKDLSEKKDLATFRRRGIQQIRDYYQIRCLLETGLRLFEFCDLVNDDLTGHRLNVKNGKGNKPRTVLLTKGTASLLKEWLELKPLLGFPSEPHASMFPSRFKEKQTTRAIQRRIKNIFFRLKFPDHLTGHSLRHTYASLLLDTGKVGLATLKENLGHESLATTNIYA